MTDRGRNLCVVMWIRAWSRVSNSSRGPPRQPAAVSNSWLARERMLSAAFGMKMGGEFWCRESGLCNIVTNELSPKTCGLRYGSWTLARWLRMAQIDAAKKIRRIGKRSSVMEDPNVVVLRRTFFRNRAQSERWNIHIGK